MKTGINKGQGKTGYGSETQGEKTGDGSLKRQGTVLCLEQKGEKFATPSPVFHTDTRQSADGKV